MTFVYSFHLPKTQNEKFMYGVLSDNIKYGKLTKFCNQLKYKNIDEFLEIFISEFDKTCELNSEEMLKRSFPYRLYVFKNYKDVWIPIIGEFIRSSQKSFFEIEIFKKIILTWVRDTFQSSDFSIAEQRSKLKLFSLYISYIEKKGFSYPFEIIEIAEHELEKRIQREQFQLKKSNIIDHPLIDDYQASKIVIIAEDLMKSNFIEESYNFSQIFILHSDILSDEFSIKWNAHLSDLCLLIICIEEFILNCQKENSQALNIIELKFVDKNNDSYAKESIIQALSRARTLMNEFSIQVPKKKSNAPFLYNLVLKKL